MENNLAYCKKLYGDDFKVEEIQKWYEDEESAYFNLYGENDKCNYEYHELNNLYGYKYLKDLYFKNVLGIGSAFGDEFIPILNQIDKITIIESSNKFWSNNINGHSVRYAAPTIKGDMKFGDNTFDLITCFGVLHHIPNVSYVVSEIYRCLKKGGYFLVREPILSMGDWTKERVGLTKHERGIPIDVFRQIIKNFTIVNEQKFAHPITTKILSRFMKKSVFNSRCSLFLDNLFCKSFIFEGKYHAENVIDKIRPSSVYYVLKKQ